MPHMIPEIHRDHYYVVETSAGTWIVPYHVHGPIHGVHELQPYCEGTVLDHEPHSLCEGYVYRLSAPGYLDCTDWCAAESEQEAREQIEQAYEICSYCGERIPDAADQPTIEQCDTAPQCCPHCGHAYLDQI